MNWLRRYLNGRLLKAVSQGDVLAIHRWAVLGAEINGRAGVFGTTPLVEALDNNREANEREVEKIVRTLLDLGADANTPNAHGRTPLRIAVACWRQGSILGLLLENGAIDEESDGDIALHSAVEQRVPLELLRRLVCVCTNLNAPFPDGYELKYAGATVLHVATARLDTELVSLLLENGANVNSRDRYDATPLHEGCHSHADEQLEFDMAEMKSRQARILRILADAGANLNAQTEDGETPLHIAAHDGNQEAIEFLLTDGAAVDVTDGFGCSAAQEAARVGNTECAKMLTEAGAAMSLPLAIALGDREKVRQYLAKGADTEAALETGETPLEIALRNGQLQLALFLLDSGAKATGRALAAASQHGQTEAVARLLKDGAPADGGDETPISPLEWADMGENPEVAALLREAGATRKPDREQTVERTNVAEATEGSGG